LQARACLEQAMALAPQDPTHAANLAELLRRAGLPAQALPAARQAVQMGLRHAGAHLNLGYVLLDLGDAAQALPHFEQAATLDAAMPQAWFGLGRALSALRRPAQAAQALRECLARAPNDAEAHLALAQVLRLMGDLPGGWAHAMEASRRLPSHPGVVCIQADLLTEDAQPREAERLIEQALSRMPATAGLRYRLALCQLDRGDYTGGFATYESRLLLGDQDVSNRIRIPMLPMPRWQGEDLRGRRLLVMTEQGYGDHIQCCRFIVPLAERGVDITMAVAPPLADLMRTLPGVGRVLTRIEDARDSGCDAWTFVCSLPHRLGVDATRVRVTSLHETAAPRPGGAAASSGPVNAVDAMHAPGYLQADPARRARWRERLGPRLPGPDGRPQRRIGLVWSGRAENDYERRRSPPLAALAPLGQVPGIRWLALQTGARAAEAVGAQAPWPIEVMGEAELGSFADTAALMAELDLLISIDTAYTHLAGAIGAPVWLMLPRAADWRWSLQAETSPWYPSVRIFRQQAAGDWAGVAQRIAQALGRLPPEVARP
jgi:cytochrome c-type biogenesis protein CcmH/NrfG